MSVHNTSQKRWINVAGETFQLEVVPTLHGPDALLIGNVVLVAEDRGEASESELVERLLSFACGPQGNVCKDV